MSAHRTKSRKRHPDPTTFSREQFPVGHLTFEVIDHPDHGPTFALFAGYAPKDGGKALFSGHLQQGMGIELRRLAHRVDELEPNDRGQS